MSLSKLPEGTVRKRKVPQSLRKKGPTAIKEWARKELNGQEPLLDRKTIHGINDGTIVEVLLRPVKHGFFAPDGTFIEAFEYKPEFGEDIDIADKKWIEEEEDRNWADEENKLFNKETSDSANRKVIAMWEHGKRINDYAQKKKYNVHKLLVLLDKRKTSSGYSRFTHQICIDFYHWQPNIESFFTKLDWSWEQIDALYRFSNDNNVRNHLKIILESTEIGKMKDEELRRILGTKLIEADVYILDEEKILLQNLRLELKRCITPNSYLINSCITIITSLSIERLKKIKRSNVSNNLLVN